MENWSIIQNESIRIIVLFENVVFEYVLDLHIVQ